MRVAGRRRRGWAPLKRGISNLKKKRKGKERIVAQGNNLGDNLGL
jgi:hypothetical protein